MPDTKPDLHFDDNGVCDACRSQDAKNNIIDWKSREQEFLDLVKKHKKHPDYDCIIGVSGGKDSTFQVLKALDLGLNPLCICFEPTIPTIIGKGICQKIKDNEVQAFGKLYLTTLDNAAKKVLELSTYKILS